MSGGVDSTSTAIIVFNMCRLVVEAVAAHDAEALKDVRNVVGDQTYVPTTPQELAGKMWCSVVCKKLRIEMGIFCYKHDLKCFALTISTWAFVLKSL